MGDLLRERGCRPALPLEIVKYGQYSPLSTDKPGSALPETTALLSRTYGCILWTLTPSACCGLIHKGWVGRMPANFIYGSINCAGLEIFAKAIFLSSDASSAIRRMRRTATKTLLK